MIQMDYVLYRSVVVAWTRLLRRALQEQVGRFSAAHLHVLCSVVPFSATTYAPTLFASYPKLSILVFLLIVGLLLLFALLLRARRRQARVSLSPHQSEILSAIKKSKNASLCQTEELSSLAEHTSDIVVRFDRDLRHVYINPAIEKHTGIPQKQFIGRTNEELNMPAEQVRQWNSALLEVFRTGQEGEMFFAYATPSGPRYYHSRLAPEFGSDGTVDTVLSINRDITEHRQAEDKLRQYATELENVYGRLDEELKNAMRAHQHLVQRKLPQVEGVSLAAAHSPATFVGGDFSCVIQKGDLLMLYASDITGHGLEGTMFSLFVKGRIESYLELVPQLEITPDKVLRYLDRQVRQGGYLSEYAVSIFLMVVNVKTREATFSSAGFQNPPVLVHSDGLIEMLASQGLPISPDIPSEAMDFECHTVSLPTDAFLFLATDGIYEQRSGAQMYEQRLLKLLKQCAGFPPNTVKDVVNADFQDFLGERSQDDDVTFVVLSTQDSKVPGTGVPGTVGVALVPGTGVPGTEVPGTAIGLRRVKKC